MMLVTQTVNTIIFQKHQVGEEFIVVVVTLPNVEVSPQKKPVLNLDLKDRVLTVLLR